MPALLTPTILGSPSAIGARLRDELGTWRPACAVRTVFSPLEGARRPADWGTCLAAWDGDGSPGRVLLADRDDLMGLPAAVAAWGRERVAVGATVRWGDGDARLDVILLAPTAEAYARLCRTLSLRYAGGDGRRCWQESCDLTGLSVLTRSPDLVRPLRDRGAAVWWRCDTAPDDPPAGVPAVAFPVFTALAAADRAGDPVRRAVARREDRPVAPGAALVDLVAMQEAYADRGDLVDAGRALLDRCTYVPGGTWHMPPSLHPDPDGELRARAIAGARRRYGEVLSPEVQDRLERELHVIAAKGFSGYILTVADLSAGRRTCGRGSGASSLVVYCLGITNVDPVRYHLLFERFLNPARTDPPDLDIDFPWDERDAVLAAALRTYGREHVAMVSNHLYLRRWSALRVVARAFHRGDAETSQVRHQVRASERYGDPLRLREPWPGILAQAEHLVDTPHHLGLHCGGIVITPAPLRDLVPVHPAAKTIPWLEEDDEEHAGPPPRIPIPAIAWEKDGAEAMGLVKIDLLGNRSLAVVRDALADLAEDGIHIDEVLWRPAEDPTTCALVAAGDTLGCFYIESPAMRQLQAKAASGEFDRLVVHSSIIRPAANRWIVEYLTRLHHFRATGRQEEAWYPHPALRGLLSDSFGILSYQEDVMLAAIRIAGFDDRQANGLRKALGHWDTGSRLTAFAEEFRRGAAARGASATAIETVWSMIASFAGYSFCKAHSASYAMVSFQCAFLKAHYPAYFLARVVANEGGFYTPAVYLEEARRQGIAILAPCVVASDWLTRRERADAIRCGLHLVPGLSAMSGGRIVAERGRQPFAGIADLLRRCGLSASQLDTLARAGALDALCPGAHRAQVQAVAAHVALAQGPRTRPVEEEEGTTFLFDIPVDPDPPLPDLPALSPREVAWQQFQALGFSPAGHPLWFAALPASRVRCRQITPAWRGRKVTLYAWPITRKQVETHPKPIDGRARAGEAMAFVTLEDETGLVETVWFPKAYRAWGPALDRGMPLRLQGTVQVEFGVANLEVERAEGVAIA